MSALQGLRIADVSGTVATAYMTKLFADYGADVWNLEPPEGFPTRGLPPFLPGTTDSAMHGWVHVGKRSVCGAPCSSLPPLDLVVHDLHVTPAAALPAGINRSALSWFGDHGPMRDYRGSDGVIQSLIGQVRNIGPTEGPPLLPTGYEAQIIGGLTAYVGTTGHLLAQRLGNLEVPFQLDTSIYEAALCLVDVGLVHAPRERGTVPRLGINRFPPTYPLGVFPCRDGWLGVTVLSPAQWQAFCRLIGMDEFADVPLFQASLSRLENIDVIEPAMRERLRELSAEELFYRGQAQRVPLARVPTMEELFRVDQFVARRAFSTINQAGTAYLAPTTPFRLFETPPALGGDVAELGADDAAWRALQGDASV